MIGCYLLRRNTHVRPDADVSQKDLDNAVVAADVARATLQARRVDVASAQVNLGFTRCAHRFRRGSALKRWVSAAVWRNASS